MLEPTVVPHLSAPSPHACPGPARALVAIARPRCRTSTAAAGADPLVVVLASAGALGATASAARRGFRTTRRRLLGHGRWSATQLRAMGAPVEGRSCRVAVIGGGPAGVASCRFLAEKGHKPVVFEAGSDFGGIWARDAPNKVVYRGLVTNLPTVAMQSFDLDFPAGLPSYVKGADLGDYFVSYAERFDLKKFFRFRTQVTSVRLAEGEGEGEAGADGGSSAGSGGSGGADTDAWAVAFEGAEGRGVEKFDAVVVAKGHYDEPYAPEILGQRAWLAGAESGARTVVHSREYDDPARHTGRAVLVVGGRSSAVDVARELRGVARWVYVLEKGCQQLMSVGECTHLPIGAALRPDGAVEVGGEVAPGPPVDDVILATGYKYVFPFLDSEQLGLEFGPEARFVEPLYMHIVHNRRPSLCFVGIPLAVPTPVHLFEAQARFVAAHLCAPFSTLAEREGWLEARRAAVGERTQDLHFLSADAWNYMRELTRMSGMAGAEYEVYERRLALVAEVYADRVAKRPQLPWGDDWFRRCQYTVDWEAGTWQVSLPEEAQQAGTDVPAAL